MNWKSHTRNDRMGRSKTKGLETRLCVRESPGRLIFGNRRCPEETIEGQEHARSFEGVYDATVRLWSVLAGILVVALMFAMVGAPTAGATVDQSGNDQPFNAVVLPGSAWAGNYATRGDLNVYSNGPTLGVVGPTGTYGLEWQCTELAVRWADVAWHEGGYSNWTSSAVGWDRSAYGLWNANLAALPQPLVKIPIGQATPLFGDLIIFYDGGLGHVGIVMSATASSITFVSENNGNATPIQTIPANGQATYLGGTAVGFIRAPVTHSAVALIPNDGASGYRVDGYGNLQPFGNAPPVTSPSPVWQGWDIVRGIAIFPRSTSAAVQGYVLDGFGGIHPFAAGNADAPPTPAGYSYWPGWDIARGIVLRGNTGSGYVLDGWGGINPFGGAPAVPISAYWPGWDIARGITLSSSIGGYVLDGWGGIHPFGDAPWLPNSAYWPGWDIARGITLASLTGGYVLDGWGGVHPFGDAHAVPSPGYSPGNDIFRGIAIDPSTGSVVDVTGVPTIPVNVWHP